MLISALARGFDKEATIAVKEKPKGPSTLKARQFFSNIIPTGIISWGQTIDSSSFVLLIEQKLTLSAQRGIGLFLAKWQIPNFSGNIESVSFLFFIAEGVGFEPTNPFGLSAFQAEALDQTMRPFLTLVSQRLILLMLDAG